MFYSLFSHSWSGLLIAAVVGAIGWLIVLAARTMKRRWSRFGWVRFLGYLFYGLAGLIVIGSIVAIVRSETLASKYPPMGRLVDVGGYRMHILAEGEARGSPSIVWITGGHGQGLGFHHLHKVMRETTRSILFDRPGTGWSDTGPFPRSTAREAEELATLLEKAGEKGPFVVVGHSYGGLLAANFARRNPGKVAALVLLDATHPDMLYGPSGGGDAMAQQVLVNQLIGLAKLLGVQINLAEMMAKSNKDVAKILDRIYGQLAEVKEPMLANDASAASSFTSASIYEEFGAKAFRRSGSELVVYDGELGALPVFVVVPPDDFRTAARQSKDKSASVARMLNLVEHMRLRYLATSSNSKLVYAPSGSSHNFPYEHPSLVLDVVRQALAGKPEVADSRPTKRAPGP